MKVNFVFILGIAFSLLTVSCAKKATDFKTQVIELQDEDLDGLLSAQEQELISEAEILALVEEYKQGKISKEELKVKFQEKIVSNGLKKKGIQFSDLDVDTYFSDKENNYKEKTLTELMNAFFRLSIHAESDFEKNGILLDALDKLRNEQDEELFKTIHAINNKITNYDLTSSISLGKSLDLIHIYNFSLINHLMRNTLVLGSELQSLNDLTVSENPLELMTHSLISIGNKKFSLIDLQQIILKEMPNEILKASLPFLLMTGAKGEAHLLGQAFLNNQNMLLFQIQTIVSTTLKYPSYVQVDQDAKLIHLNKLFFSLYQDQLGDKFESFIKDQLTTTYNLPKGDLEEFDIELDLDYVYTIDKV